MKAHWAYFKYVWRHKWFVFRGCMLLGVPLHQAITHDWVKYLPVEWFAYVDYFYRRPTADRQLFDEVAGNPTMDRAVLKTAFDLAWNHHQKTQPHHWQYWLLITDSDEPRLRPLPIPQRFVLEMVADWYGAGMAISGRQDVEPWYLANKDKMILEDGTRYRVTQAIRKLQRRQEDANDGA